MVSRNFAGTNGGNESSGEFNGAFLPYDMSDNGRYVVFESKATDLSNVSDTNNQPDIFLRDMLGNSTRLISRASSAAATGNNYSLNPNISADGRIVTFDSGANNLVAGITDNNTGPDVFITNLQTNQTKYVSFSRIDPTFAAPGGGTNSILGKNGSRVVYISVSNSLVTPNPSNVRNVIVYDVSVRANALVSINFSGTDGGNQDSGDDPSNLNITPDGRYVFFDSKASNLTPDGFDNNNFRDIFRRDLQFGETELVTLNAQRTAIANSESFIGNRGTAISADGRYVIFKSFATNLLLDNITQNSFQQVYVRDMQTLTTSLLSPNRTGNAFSSSFAVNSLAITPNGKTVVFATNAEDIAPIDGNKRNDIFYCNLTAPAVSDFDGDGRTDFAVFRPSSGTWYSLPADGFVNIRNWGNSADRIVPADYDGDGKTDHAVFRTSENNWYLQKSVGIVAETVNFGLAGDIPAPADFDGDGKADIAVFRPSNGVWYIRQSSNGQVRFQNFGLNGDLPVVGDYDGDSKADVAVFRPTENVWYILRSIDNSFVYVQFGSSGDKLVPADFDGDSRTDIAVFRPPSGEWYIFQSQNNQVQITNFGLNTDQPTPGDYDGDGRADIAVFRPSTGNWFILLSSNNNLTGANWGLAGDVPVPSAYIP